MNKTFRLSAFFAMVFWAACSPGDQAKKSAKTETARVQEFVDPTALPLAELIERADNRFTQGDLLGARELLHEELALNPDSFDAWYRLGVLDVIQDSVKVHERLEHAHSLAPDHPGPKYFQGMVYRLVGRNDLGREPLRESYALFWKNQEFDKGSLPVPVQAYADTFRARRLISAYRGFRRAAREDSTNAAVWYWYARACMDHRKGKEAVAAARHAKKLARNSPNITALLAVMYYRNKDKYGARDLVEEALELEPTNAMARHILGHLEIDNQNFRKGLIILWHAMLEEPNETSYIDYVGSYLHSYANTHLGLRVIQFAVAGRSFLAEEYDWPGYTLK